MDITCSICSIPIDDTKDTSWYCKDCGVNLCNRCYLVTGFGATFILGESNQDRANSYGEILEENEELFEENKPRLHELELIGCVIHRPIDSKYFRKNTPSVHSRPEPENNLPDIEISENDQELGTIQKQIAKNFESNLEKAQQDYQEKIASKKVVQPTTKVETKKVVQPTTKVETKISSQPTTKVLSPPKNKRFQEESEIKSNKITLERLEEIRKTPSIGISYEEFDQLPADLKKDFEPIFIPPWFPSEEGGYRKKKSNAEIEQERLKRIKYIREYPGIILDEREFKSLDPELKKEFHWVEFKTGESWNPDYKYRKANEDDIKEEKIKEVEDKIQNIFKQSRREKDSPYNLGYTVWLRDGYNTERRYVFITKEMEDEYNIYLEELGRLGGDTGYYDYYFKKSTGRFW